MTNLNLIDAAWVPVLDRDGASAYIRPADIAADGGRRYRRLASPRPDFDGALVQFLIGLLQTACMPADEAAWRRLWEAPPTPDELMQAFASRRDAFHLGGDGARFMQDLELRDGEAKPIAGLLLEAPGGNTVRNNQDHFIKRDTVAALCPPCAAMALYCLQTNAPSGGQGHRVGLRGGGPLTTLLLLDETDAARSGLWHLAWLNVLPAGLFTPEAEVPAGPAAIFPWLAATRTSEKNQKVTPLQAHPLQMYWGMPRRIRLDGPHAAEGVCDLCGRESSALVRQYHTRNFGVSYDGWVHVLSPHARESADKPPLPIHGQPGGVGFRHWAGIVVADLDHKGKGRLPARVVAHAAQQAYRRRLPTGLWAFGYDMDNMKARAWVESRLPLFLATEERREAFEALSRDFVRAAQEAFLYLRGMVKSALHGRPSLAEGKLAWAFPPHLKVDNAFFDTLAGDYWRRGETLFFPRLRGLLDHLEDEAGRQRCAEAWLQDLTTLALGLFDQAVGGVEEADHRIKAVVFARRQLGGMLHGNALRTFLSLPERTGQGGKTTNKGGKRD